MNLPPIWGWSIEVERTVRTELAPFGIKENGAKATEVHNMARYTNNRTTMAVVDIDRPSQEERDSHFKPGSIKRVKLKNFLTYDAVEFFPGPR